MFGLGFENNPLGAENCMSPKFENLKLLDSLIGLGIQIGPIFIYDYIEIAIFFSLRKFREATCEVLLKTTPPV